MSGVERTTVHIQGKIIKENAVYNSPWTFYLDPNSIQFFQVAAEVCDGNIQYVQDHLKDVGGSLLPGNVWCPWGSYLIEEIPMASQ